MTTDQLLDSLQVYEERFKKEMMSLWRKFLKPKLLWKKMKEKKSQKGHGLGRGREHGQGRRDRDNCDNNERSYQPTRGYERGIGRGREEHKILCSKRVLKSEV